NASFSLQDKKTQTLDAVTKDMKNPRLGKFGSGGSAGQTPGANVRNAKMGKSVTFNYNKLNAKVVNGGKLSAIKKGRMGKSMWQLVSAAAQTLTAKSCPTCPKESQALYSRGFATGEAVGGAGVIQMPGDADVPMDPGKMDA